MTGLENIAKRYNVEVTVKLLPEMSLYSQFKNDFTSLFRIVKSMPKFAELFSANHIIVIDSPTTTVLESVATKKPVFILLRNIQYPQGSRTLLEKRAVCEDTAQELINKIQQYVEQRTYSADVGNDEYLRTHGNHLCDGKSVQRALKRTLEIIYKPIPIV